MQYGLSDNTDDPIFYFQSLQNSYVFHHGYFGIFTTAISSDISSAELSQTIHIMFNDALLSSCSHILISKISEKCRISRGIFIREHALRCRIDWVPLYSIQHKTKWLFFVRTYVCVCSTAVAIHITYSYSFFLRMQVLYRTFYVEWPQDCQVKLLYTRWMLSRRDFRCATMYTLFLHYSLPLEEFHTANILHKGPSDQLCICGCKSLARFLSLSPPTKGST